MQSSKRIGFTNRTPTAQTLSFTGWRWFRFIFFLLIIPGLRFSVSVCSHGAPWVVPASEHICTHISWAELVRVDSPRTVLWRAVLAACWRRFCSQSTNAPKLGNGKMISGRFHLIRPFFVFKAVLALCTHLLWGWITYLPRGSVMNGKFINCTSYHISYSHFQNFVDFALNTILLNWNPMLCFCLYLSWGLVCHSFDFMFSSSFCIKCVSPK